MWPSHASTRNCGQIRTKLTRTKSLQLITTESFGKPNLIPQPKLLENLEAFLRENLAFIDESAEEDGDICLEVYRQTFTYLINKLKTYRSLLTRIKSQYEMSLDDLENQINSLKPLKATVLSTVEEYDEKICAFNEAVKPNMKILQDQNDEIQSQINKMQAKLELIGKERKETEEKLKEAYQLFRDEHDAHQLLNMEYNKLEILHSNIEFPSDSNQPPGATDLTTLKLTLRQSLLDADAMQAKLDQMIAEYADVVPRRKCESLENTFPELMESNQILKRDLNTLKAEHDALLDVNQQLSVELNDLQKECTRRKALMPNRPPWLKPCQYINPAENYFDRVSSEDTCETLLNILQEMDKNGANIIKREIMYFDGKGLNEDVPKYLQYEGRIRDRRFSKRDCALLIKDIWKMRMTDLDTCFSEYVDAYLTHNFPTELMKTEWAYNLEDACKRFAETNKNIELFWLILNEDMDENVYHTQLTVITDLMKYLSDSVLPGNAMTCNEFHEHLQTFLNPNDSEIISSLVKVALQELDAEEEINIDQLFLEDDEGEVGPFLTAIKDWFDSLRMEFCELVSKELDENSPVSIQSLDLAIRQTDPTLKTNSVKDLLCWCFRTNPEYLLKSKPLPVNEVLSRLKNANINFSHIKTYL